MLLTLKIRKGKRAALCMAITSCPPRAQWSRGWWSGVRGNGAESLLSCPPPTPPWKFIDRQGVQVRWLIYDNGAWWHHAIKALGRVTQHMPRRVPAFVFAMHEYIRGREGHWLTLLLCDGWRRLAALFVFVCFVLGVFLYPVKLHLFFTTSTILAEEHDWVHGFIKDGLVKVLPWLLCIHSTGGLL